MNVRPNRGFAPLVGFADVRDLRRRCARTMVTVAAAAAIATTATVARADDEVCREGFEQADILLKPGADDPKLIEARDKLRVCSGPTCKDWMMADCTKRLGEVEARIPSVVFAAKDGSGNELTNVTVLVGGRAIVMKLDGRAHEMNPGTRAFTFILPDGTRQEVTAIVKEGQKAQPVSWEAPLAAKEVAAPPPGADNSRSSTKSTNPLVYIGFGTAAAGVAVGTITGILALSKASTSECEGTRCTSDGIKDIDSGKTLALVSTIGFGVAILGAGVGIYGLLSPGESRSSTAKRTITPWLGLGQAGLRGAF